MGGVHGIRSGEIGDKRSGQAKDLILANIVNANTALTGSNVVVGNFGGNAEVFTATEDFALAA